MNHNRILIGTLLVVIAILLVGCGNTETAEKDLPVIKYVNFKIYDPVYVAIDEGFFEKHGVKVEIIGDVLAGPTAIQAVSSGEAQAGVSSIFAIINANAAGLPVIGVTDLQSALPGQPLEYYYSLKDSPYQTLEDLPGAVHAVNLWRSSFHYTALMALEQAGVDEDAVEFVLLPFDNQLPALLAGEVDVIALMEPYNARALAVSGDQLHLVYDAEQIFGQKQFSLHFINRIWAADHPDEAKAFVSGIVDAIAWIEANQEDAKAIISKYTGIEVEYVPVYHYQENGHVVMEDVQFFLDYLIERGDVEATWLQAENIATNQYNYKETK